MTSTTTHDRHQGACRMLGHALTLEDDAKAWDGLSLVMRCRLTGFERACVLTASYRSLESEDARYVVERIVARESAGMPMPPLLDPMEDATWWAGHASAEERRAVLVAAFQGLSVLDQRAFLDFVNGRVAA